MSIFNELLPKIFERSETSNKNLKDELEAALECLHKFERDYLDNRASTREKTQKEKSLMTTLQSITEDDVDDPKKTKSPETTTTASNGKSTEDKSSDSSTDGNETRRRSKKRSKEEVDGIQSPELDKRQKRNASVKAQTIISKQVNVNLSSKMRREDSALPRPSRRRDNDKENDAPVPVIQIKQEKISVAPEPMDVEPALAVKQEPAQDDIAMPPPALPMPKSRKAQKEPSKPDESLRESGRRSARRKPADAMPPPAPIAPPPSSRSARASSRASRAKPEQEDSQSQPTQPPVQEGRSKRTRTKKKISDSSTTEAEVTQENGIASPAEKPRPKRTRRGQKAAEKENQKPESEPETPKETPPVTQKEPEPKQPNPEPKVPETTALIIPKEERISEPTSPLLQKSKKTVKEDAERKTKPKATKSKKIVETIESQSSEEIIEVDSKTQSHIVLEETRVLEKMNVTVTISNDMNQTMVLPNGVYSHAPITPKSIVVNANETEVIEARRETMVLEKHAIMDTTVVLERMDEPRPANLTDDNSLLTDDDSGDFHTPPGKQPTQPTSAVKEKVQQFEELAARTTRTKTRAMAKMEEPDTQTPPDKIMKPVLSAETLNKMNNLIFNGKPAQVSSSAIKPRALPPSSKPQPASTSKLAGLSRHRELADDAARRDREDAIKKKEALLEAKREQQRRRREEKMAAAAASRAATERERRIAMEAAVKERLEKQAHADQGKLERLREVERKKIELARKAAETEERRRVEEAARAARLAEEQKRADAIRRKQLEEAALLKKEEAKMAKEIEKKHKEYMEKQKMKRSEDTKSYTPLKAGGQYAIEPVYMCDGFQYLNSDEEDEGSSMPRPDWSLGKSRRLALSCQADADPALVARLFSVRVHSPDLREIFPSMERARLKRTSSAVWRTPPNVRRLPAVAE